MRYVFITDDRTTLAVYDEGKEVIVLHLVVQNHLLPQDLRVENGKPQRPKVTRQKTAQRMGRKSKFTDEEKSEFLRKYESGSSPEELASEYGMPNRHAVYSLISRLKKQGLKLTGRKRQRRSDFNATGKHFEDDEPGEDLGLKIAALREKGKTSLQIAAMLGISLKKVNEYWNYSDPEELPPDEPASSEEA